ncbi:MULTISPECIES: AEC family transporter [Prochlorococcus]|uniref:Predicted permease n=1 Tax=Prochlorococcus marinus (strain SARG / CCMP1375 / SS120) TaxID=167539 RepID=Q7VB96_PROMA|nr:MULTISPECIES: AEC family transporter [Prochlorococcus]AAQ00246.1 Predicted permease [Prochlorococcus marinus subsp. marinus str. CCMP1375]KGG14049.1 putative AEC transporter family [Prochlorococcus marinus str. LG]KGG19182.1 putative AEC transporter family [Prochlorococcus marinus str. SS2]KGG23278.1 putative AEC transporter family [Prochlorococcus marinus str. SS35]KGG32487.1 putative AEC transporter family [Prochlorococcus marinus str. SS51]
MEIVYLLFELIPCLSIGYLIGRFNQNLSLKIAKPLTTFGIPISLMGLLLKSGMNWQLIEAAAIALLTIGISIFIINISPSLQNLFSNQTFLLGSHFGNTGYFGIPISLALLPTEALSFSIGFDIGATLIIWSLGPLIMAHTENRSKKISQWRIFLRSILNSPASKGLLGALVVQCTPWNQQITSFLWMPSKIVIFLALIIVGMRISFLNISKNKSALTQIMLIKNALTIKLLFLPSLMLSICTILKVGTTMRNSLVLQAATPTAISILLISEASAKNQNSARSLVVWSTCFSLISIPLWAMVLKIS